VAEIIKHANAQRYTVASEDVQQNSIKIADEWQEQLESMPFFSKQKGRMSALLKMKSKIATKKKPRVQYQPHVSLQRIRG
jgi:hypothetical protein